MRTLGLPETWLTGKCQLGVMSHGRDSRSCAKRAPGFRGVFSALAGRPLVIRGTVVRQGRHRFLAVNIEDVKMIR
jgi:hypothetical protein